MSVEATDWVFDHSKSTGATRLVLLALGRHAHDDGIGAWPAAETIAREAGVDRRTVQRALRWGLPRSARSGPGVSGDHGHG